MVVIDATILMLFLRPDAGVPLGPGNVPIAQPRERVAHLIDRPERSKVKVVIPTPVLSEVLVRVDTLEAQQLVELIMMHAAFRIEPFDVRAAIEVASMTRNAIDGGKRPGRRDPQATWAKLKYDRQIVAIARVSQATTIYSDDRDIRTIAARVGISVVGLADLDLPPEVAQGRLPFREGAGSGAGSGEED